MKSGPLAGPVVSELAEYLCTASCTKIHKTGESRILMSYTHWNGMTLYSWLLRHLWPPKEV